MLHLTPTETEAAATTLLILVVLVRRFAGTPINGRMLLVPAVLTFTGYAELTKKLRDQPVSHVDHLFLSVGVAVAAFIGVLRALTIRISRRNGVLVQRYRPMTLLVWAVAIGARAAIAEVGNVSGDHLGSSADLLVTIGAGLLAEAVVVMLRAPLAARHGATG
jgi:hypothetical protein